MKIPYQNTTWNTKLCIKFRRTNSLSLTVKRIGLCVKSFGYFKIIQASGCRANLHRHQLHAVCIILLKYLLAVPNKALAYSSSWIKKRTAFIPTHCTRSPEQRWARAVVIKAHAVGVILF